MNKIAIPAILVATVMVAGMFAFMPVEQASTVHTSGVTSQASDIAVLDEQIGTEADANSVQFLLNIASIAEGEGFEARFNLQLTDTPDAAGTVAPTILVEVWDGDEWQDANVTEPTPADGGNAITMNIVVTGVAASGGEIRFTVDEGSDNTGATIDLSGIIIE